MKVYACIDLKSFYASVECIERGLDPMNTNLLVADVSRTEKTICLAVTPSLKAYGISGRARLFEVNEKLREINQIRKHKSPNKQLVGKSYFDKELKVNPELAVSYIAAPPRMAYYMKYSTKIYEIYLSYFSPEDIHIYSIDEVFIDISSYFKTYNKSPKQLIMSVIQDIYNKTGITATAGIGTNLYLCKIAMDIVAKHIPADRNGVRIAMLNEMTYRKLLWSHRPITDFWRVGNGYAKKLQLMGLYTMGDIARYSVTNEEQLYKTFGVQAELLIDHAWGWEPCTIKAIKEYVPENSSLSSGQVLSCPYTCDKARLVIHEMADAISLELVEKNLFTNQIVITIGYDIANVNKKFKGMTETDRYGRKIPKGSTGSINIEYTSSSKEIVNATLNLYDRIINTKYSVRRMTIAVNHLINEKNFQDESKFEQLDLFTDTENYETERNKKIENFQNERNIQQAVLSLKRRYGKNAVLKGMNLFEDATAISRNKQIGGHKA